MLSKLLKKHIPVDVSKMRAAKFLESQRELELMKVENVRRRNGWKDVALCPLCGSKKYKDEFKKYEIPLVMCLNCQLRFHTKIPLNPNDIYQDPSYKLFSKEDSEEHYNYRKERFGRERVKLLEKYCGDLSEKKILDVGCGNGYFLSAAKEKCKNCLGSEFSSHLREMAKKKTGLPIYSQPLEEFPQRDIDIITAFDVIEHIEKPAQFVKAASKLLKPGGYMLLYTPNFDSFSIKVMKEQSAIIDPTEHLILFTHNSLKELGNIVGLKVLHIETRGLDINSIIAFQSYLGEGLNNFLAKWLNELQAMIDASGAADYLRIIYAK